MKKMAFLLILILVISFLHLDARSNPAKTTPASAHSFSITLGGGGRYFTGDDEDVYNFINLVFALDVAYKFNKSIEIFLHGEYLSAKGKLTITEEETTLNIIPAELGGRFLFGKKRFFSYLGAGLGYYFIKEDNPIGTINESGIGFFGEAGIKTFFTNSLFLDIKLRYVALSIKPEDTSVDLGGIAVLAGLGIAF